MTLTLSTCAPSSSHLWRFRLLSGESVHGQMSVGLICGFMMTDASMQTEGDRNDSGNYL
jgi:hypothetical protein